MSILLNAKIPVANTERASLRTDRASPATSQPCLYGLISLSLGFLTLWVKAHLILKLFWGLWSTSICSAQARNLEAMGMFPTHCKEWATLKSSPSQYNFVLQGEGLYLLYYSSHWHYSALKTFLVWLRHQVQHILFHSESFRSKVK